MHSILAYPSSPPSPAFKIQHKIRMLKKKIIIHAVPRNTIRNYSTMLKKSNKKASNFEICREERIFPHFLFSATLLSIHP